MDATEKKFEESDTVMKEKAFNNSCNEQINLKPTNQVMLLMRLIRVIRLMPVLLNRFLM